MNYLRKETRTITALVTAPITQNVAIIRISGQKTYKIIENIFSKKIKQEDRKNKIFFGKITRKNLTIDQVLLLCFCKPNSFTGEDLVEISCHGNLIIVNQILELILENGAEMAVAGEFTKQGFFNGKLNLIQANAINDLIKAPSLSTTKLAIQNFDSKKQKELERLEDKLLEAIAKIEINIDYPEYDDVEKITVEKLKKTSEYLLDEIKKVKWEAEKATFYKEGIKVGIFGKPNVGKSTLLNILLKKEKAIVSPIAGTTRDVIEDNFVLKGIPIRIFDTAGIRKTKNEIEKKGIEKSKEIYEKSDLLFLILDNSKIWNKEDEEIFNLIKNKNYILVINKSDLKKKIVLPDRVSRNKNIVEISAERNEIEKLENKIVEIFSDKMIENFSPYPFLSHSWQQSKVTSIEKYLEEIIVALEKQIPVDIITGDLQNCLRLIRELSGKDYDENLLDIIFSKFCLGK